MSALLILAETGSPGRVEEIARTFGVDLPHLGAQIISFGIVCFLLHRFAYKRVLAMLKQRREQIADGLASAEKMKADLTQFNLQRREILRQAHIQAERLVEEARAAAARVLDQETEKAKATAAEIVLKAHEAAEHDHDRMLVALRREVGRLVVETTAAVTGKIITAEDQQRLAEETVKYIAV